MVFEKVKGIIAKQLGIEEGKVTLESHLIDDLKADSLDVVELIMDLEQEFDIEIPDEDLPKVTRVKDIVFYIESNV
jgi:acyl carrier protein